jgi:hypothetical protein
MLAHAAGKIGTISHLAREPVRVDDESFFSRIAIAGKHFPEKLLTSSHNSQNRNLPDTQSGFSGKPELWRRGRRSHAQHRFCFREPVGNRGRAPATRQQPEIDGDKFAPDAALSGGAKQHFVWSAACPKPQHWQMQERVGKLL